MLSDVLARACLVVCAASLVGCTDHSELLTIAQTDSIEIENGLQCGPNVEPVPYTTETSFYRVFDLRAFGVRGGFRIREVAFAIRFADARGEDPTQHADLVISEFRGERGGDALDETQIFPIATLGVAIPNIVREQARLVRYRLDRDDASAQTPITIPAHVGSIAIELHMPREQTNQRTLIVGTNLSAGEATTAYIRCPAVDGLEVPMSVAKRHSGHRLILQMTGFAVPTGGASAGSRPPGGWLLSPDAQRQHAVGGVVIDPEPDDGVDPADRGIREIENAQLVVGE